LNGEDGLSAIYSLTEPRNSPIAGKWVKAKAVTKFKKILKTEPPNAVIPRVPIEDFQICPPYSDGHISLAGSGALDHPRSKGGRAKHFFDWLISQEIDLPTSMEEAHGHHIWSPEIAAAYMRYCKDACEGILESGIIQMRAQVIAELGKARIVTLLPAPVVQYAIAVQKAVLGTLKRIPEIEVGVFSTDDGYRAYVDLPSSVRGFLCTDLSEATDHPNSEVRSVIIDRLIDRMETDVWDGVCRFDRDLIEALKFCKGLLALPRRIRIEGDEFIAKRGIPMGDPLTKVVMTLALYFCIKCEFPNKWFRMKGDDLILESSPRTGDSDLVKLNRVIDEASFKISEVDTYYSSVAFYCEAIFWVKRPGELPEFMARQVKERYSFADPPKGRMVVPFWKTNYSPRGHAKDPMVLPLTKLGVLSKRSYWFKKGSRAYRRNASAIATAIASLRLKRDITLNLPQHYGGCQVDPDIFGERNNAFYWYWFQYLQGTLMGYRKDVPSERPPHIERYVARKQNHSFSHRLRIKPEEVIPEKWRELAIRTDDFVGGEVEISTLLNRSVQYTSETTLASYLLSLEDFLERFLGISPTKRGDPGQLLWPAVNRVNSVPVPVSVKTWVERNYRFAPHTVKTVFYPTELVPDRLIVFKSGCRPIGWSPEGKLPRTVEELFACAEKGLNGDLDILASIAQTEEPVIVVVTPDKRLCKEAARMYPDKVILQVDMVADFFGLYECQTADEVIAFVRRANTTLTCSIRGHHIVTSQYQWHGTPDLESDICLILDQGLSDKVESLTVAYRDDGQPVVSSRLTMMCSGEHTVRDYQVP
jgi:hypothetical protein